MRRAHQGESNASLRRQTTIGRDTIAAAAAAYQTMCVASLRTALAAVPTRLGFHPSLCPSLCLSRLFFLFCLSPSAPRSKHTRAHHLSDTRRTRAPVRAAMPTPRALPAVLLCCSHGLCLCLFRRRRRYGNEDGSVPATYATDHFAECCVRSALAASASAVVHTPAPAAAVFFSGERARVLTPCPTATAQLLGHALFWSWPCCDIAWPPPGTK